MRLWLLGWYWLGWLACTAVYWPVEVVDNEAAGWAEELRRRRERLWLLLDDEAILLWDSNDKTLSTELRIRLRNHARFTALLDEGQARGVEVVG